MAFEDAKNVDADSLRHELRRDWEDATRRVAHAKKDTATRRTQTLEKPACSFYETAMVTTFDSIPPMVTTTSIESPGATPSGVSTFT